MPVFTSKHKYEIIYEFLVATGIHGMKSFPVKKQINMKSSISFSISVLTTKFGILKSSSRYSL